MRANAKSGPPPAPQSIRLHPCRSKALMHLFQAHLRHNLKNGAINQAGQVHHVWILHVVAGDSTNCPMSSCPIPSPQLKRVQSSVRKDTKGFFLGNLQHFMTHQSTNMSKMQLNYYQFRIGTTCTYPHLRASLVSSDSGGNKSHIQNLSRHQQLVTQASFRVIRTGKSLKKFLMLSLDA